jgi:hypothetical protein
MLLFVVVFWVDKTNGGILQEWISSCYQSKIDSCLSLPPPPLPSLPTLPSSPNFGAFVRPDNTGGKHLIFCQYFVIISILLLVAEKDFNSYLSSRSTCFPFPPLLNLNVLVLKT